MPRIEIKGLDKLNKKAKEKAQEVPKEILKEITKGTLAVHRTAIEGIQKGSRSGIAYKNHQASAPGEYPKTDTGNLVSKIFFRIDKNELVGEVGTALDYGVYLELGTSRMSPRPWLQPSFNKHKQDIQDGIKEVLKKELNKNG